MKSFVNYDLDGEAFCSEFLSLQNEDMEKTQVLVQQVESSFRTMSEFYFTPKSVPFGDAMDSLFEEIELFNSELEDSQSSSDGNSEGKLRSIVQEKILPKIQNYCSNEPFAKSIDARILKSKTGLELTSSNYENLISGSFRTLLVCLGLSSFLILNPII